MRTSRWLPVKLSQGATSHFHGQRAIPNEAARQRDRRRGVGHQQKALALLLGQALLHGQLERGVEVVDAVVQRLDGLALARWVVHRRPGWIDLREEALQGRGRSWAWVKARPGFDGRIPFR